MGVQVKMLILWLDQLLLSTCELLCEIGVLIDDRRLHFHYDKAVKVQSGFSISIVAMVVKVNYCVEE